jgi:HK97 family phage major capsid protein
MTSVSDAIEQIGTNFDVFKKTHISRLDRIEKRLDEREEAEAIGDRPRASGGGDKTYTPEQREHKATFLDWVRRPTDERCKSRIAEAQHELQTKDVSIGTTTAGGFGLPKEIADQIEVRVRQLNPFRGLVDTVTCSSNDFNYLVSMGDGTSGWSSETGSRSATNSPTLRNVAPSFGELYALPTASNWSLEDLAFDVQQWLVDDISADWSSAEATAIISGNGTDKPTGILNSTPSSSGDDSSPMRAQNTIQYVPLTNPGSPFTSTSNYIDSLIDLVSTVKERYLQEKDRCAFVMNRLSVARIRKAKASTGGNYLWEESSQAGQPATLLGYPVLTCDAMGSLTSANAFPILFGNWRRGYLLADRTSMQLTLDPYSTPGKTRFYARRRVGGRVKNCDAIKALKIAVS